MSTLTHTGSHPVLGCLETIAEALDDVATVEPVFMTTEQKQTALIELTKLSSRVASLKLRVLAAADDIAVETGARSTAAWLADAARDAHGSVLRSARLADAVDGRCRHVGVALAKGRINLAQAHVIVAALRDGSETHLLELADKFGPRELRRLGDRLLEAIAPDIADEAEYQRLLAEERRAHAATRLTFKPRGDGSTDLHARIPDHVANRLRAYLDSYTSPRRAALGEVDALPVSRRRGEAFCALLENLPDSGLPKPGAACSSTSGTTTPNAGTPRWAMSHHASTKQNQASVREARARPKPTTRPPGPAAARPASKTAPCSAPSTTTWTVHHHANGTTTFTRRQ